jgi:hypothetical protein
METTRIQTVLRLPPELMARVKRSARKEKCSFNSYVERILDQATGQEFPSLPPDFELSGEICALARFECKAPTARALETDPKLAYLWEKYGNV